MKKLITLMLISFVFFAQAKVQVVVVVQKGIDVFELSKPHVVAQLKKNYPEASFSFPTKPFEIVFDNSADTLILYLLTHSMPFPADVQQFGKLIICLDKFADFETITNDDLKERILTSNNLHKKLEAFRGRKLVIFDGCHAQLAWKNIPNTTWLFSTNTKTTSLGMVGIGSLFSNYFRIKKGLNSLQLAVSINKELKNAKYYNKKDHPDYHYVPEESKPSLSNPQKSYHHGQTFIF